MNSFVVICGLKKGPTSRTTFPSLEKNSHGQSSLVQSHNIENDNSIEQFKIISENTMGTGYQYPFLNSNTISSKPILPDSSNIQENNNSDLSLKEEIPDNMESESNEIEDDTANELLDILAEEIYRLLQQRIEIEKERQGNYYS